MLRRHALLGTALAAATFALPPLTAWAATQVPFTQAAFDAAKAAGKPILVAVHADWCPICTKQKPIIGGLLQQPALKDLVMFTVDFDKQKDIVAAFGVTKQSTLIAMHGKVEKDRSVGITAEDAIKALIMKTVA